MNMLKISKAIFRSLLSSRSLCVVVVALMVLCALPVFRSAAGIDGRVEYLESGITRVEQELSASYADALVNAGEAVLCSIPLLVMAYGVISVVAALTAAISRNPVVTGMVCAVLLVLGSLSAHVESVGMGVALLAPFASFDPASQVGTIGFLGRGTNAMPFGEVVGASGALLVVLGAVSPLMVRLSVPKIERG